MEAVRSAEERFPLIELGPITDLFAENIDRIEVFGEHARIIFWRWRQFDGTHWQRVALEWAIIRPLKSFQAPLDTYKHLRIVRPPIVTAIGLH